MQFISYFAARNGFPCELPPPIEVDGFLLNSANALSISRLSPQSLWFTREANKLLLCLGYFTHRRQKTHRLVFAFRVFSFLYATPYIQLSKCTLPKYIILRKRGERQFISRLRSHQREQGSLEAGDFLPAKAKFFR